MSLVTLKSLDYDTETAKIFKEQVSFIIGPNYVISLQENVSELFTSVQKRLHNQQGRIRKMQSGYLAYALMDVIVDNYFVMLEQLSDSIELLEEEAIENPTPDVLKKINSMKRQVLHLRKPFLPLREVFTEVLHDETPIIPQETEMFFRDVYDHVIQIIQTLEILRNTVSGLYDTYTSAVNHRMNEIMKVLTIVSTFFIPLTFIAGIYGMNFKFMPELEKQWG
jgi:magnesium transporter